MKLCFEKNKGKLLVTGKLYENDSLCKLNYVLQDYGLKKSNNTVIRIERI